MGPRDDTILSFLSLNECGEKQGSVRELLYPERSEYDLQVKVGAGKF